MTRRITVPFGPLHAALEEPMYFKVEVEGETVTGLEITAGHVHRGIEHLALKRNLLQNITLLERVCSLCSNSHPSTFCAALEEIAGIRVPERAEYLRVVADEVKRIASNLFNCAVLAHVVGFESLFMHVMQVREGMQDVKETLYGNRMDLAANCVGGVRRDLGLEKVAFARRQLDALKAPLDEIVALYEGGGVLRERTEGVGTISREDALRFGLVGPVARGSGVAYDVRRKAPYFAYDRLRFEVQVEQAGDARSRALVRLREAREAIGIIEQCFDDMPGGPTRVEPLPEIPAGEAVAKSEAPRGELIYYVRTDGTDRPVRVKWRVPTYMNWGALPVMLRGNTVSDIPLVVNSIDPCISCTER